MATEEQLRGPMLRGPMTSLRSGDGPITDPWFGTALIASGSINVVVSTALVTSNAVILVTPRADALLTVGSIGANLVVGSIVSATSFVIARETGVAIARDTTVGWLMIL